MTTPPALFVLEDWNPWWEEQKGHVPPNLRGRPRSMVDEVQQYLSLHKVKTFVGVRRAGKSTILYQLIHLLLTEQGCPPNSVLFLNLEDIRLTEKTVQEWYELFLQVQRPQEIPHIFLDEVHSGKDWVSFVRRLVDRKEAFVYLTDSSSYLLPPELGKVLTGRKVTFEVYPLSFREYLEFRGEGGEFFGTVGKTRGQGMVREYLTRGGFPEVVDQPPTVARKVLLEYFEDIVGRDVAARFQVNLSKFREFAYYVISNPATRMSYRRLQNVFKLGTDVPQRYLEHMENVFLTFPLLKYSTKLSEQVRSPKKIYPVDPGLVNAVGFKLVDRMGPLLEVVVYLELRRRGLEVYYGDFGSSEVDFIVRQGTRVTSLINVTYDMSNESVVKREVKGLVKGFENFPNSQLLLLVWEVSDKWFISDETSQISVKSVWEWLLMSDNSENTK